MAKFRSKPREIDAEQFFKHEPLPFMRQGALCFDGGGFFVVTIHDQKCYVEDGDWIVPEPDGRHFYPIKPDIFAANYEPVTP